MNGCGSSGTMQVWNIVYKLRTCDLYPSSQPRFQITSFVLSTFLWYRMWVMSTNVYISMNLAVSAHSLTFLWRQMWLWWCVCDLSNELSVIATVVLHLACKPKFLAKNGISCPNQDVSLHWKAFYAVNCRQPFLRLQRFHQKITW